MKNRNIEHSIPNHGLSKIEKEKADSELRKHRFERLNQINEPQKIYADLIRLKLKIVDYLKNDIFSESYLFSEVLKKYCKIINISRRQLASDLGIHETKFSKFANNKENPGVGVIYRIEEHSNGILNAGMLWKLVSMKVVVEIENNRIEKRKQAKLVKNKLKLKSA